METQYNQDKFSNILEIMPFTGTTGSLVSYTQENLSKFPKTMVKNTINKNKVNRYVRELDYIWRRIKGLHNYCINYRLNNNFFKKKLNTQMTGMKLVLFKLVLTPLRHLLKENKVCLGLGLF